MKADVLVLGAGPAGSVAARRLALAGARVVVIDTGHPGRPKIGETLPPVAATLLKELELDAALAGPHLRSTGNRSAWGQGHVVETSFIRSPYGCGWHVDRTAFDAALRRTAEEAGATFVWALRCRTEHGPQWRSRVLLRSGKQGVELRADFAVDATGRVSALAVRQGARRLVHDRLIAAWQLFEAPGDADDATTIEAVEQGWFYTARLPRGRRIVALFTDADLLPSGLRCRQELLRARLDDAPHVAARALAGGYRPASPVRIALAATSRLARPAGSAWIAVGDAAMTYDPLSSLGIATALTSGHNGAATLIEAADGGRKCIERYIDGMAGAFADYLATSERFYAKELRWPRSPFWARRQPFATQGPSNGLPPERIGLAAQS